MTFDRRRDANRRGPSPSELETLRTRLRRGDPAADGSEPSDDEIRALRERVTQAADAADKAPRPAPPLWIRRPAVAAALLILALGAALVAGLGDRRLGPERRSAETAELDSTTRQAPGGSTASPAERARQIHFTAPGGTRIVWVLYREPAAHPSAGDSGGSDDRRGTT